MKNIIILLLFNPFILLAQQYTKEVDLPDIPSEQLYNRTMDLFAFTFNSDNHIIQLNDPEQKKIVGKGVTRIEFIINKTPVNMNVYFIINARFKDNKCIYEIQSSEISATGGESYSYELLKEMGTMEGLKAFYKSRSIPVWIVGKKKFKQNMESNRYLTAKVENKLHKILDEFALSFKKEMATNN